MMVSERELKRRRMCQLVLIQAWRYRKRDPVAVDLSTAFTLSWAVMQSRSYMHHAKARGVTFGERQRILEKLSHIPEERISLRMLREKDNTFDENAVAVIAIIDGAYKAHVGYLQKETAERIAPEIDGGKRCIAFFGGVTGNEDRRFGINFIYAVLDKRKAAKSGE